MPKKITLIKPSTRAFFTESRKLGRYRPVAWLHGYIYGRWIYQYIGIGTGEHPIVKYLTPLEIFKLMNDCRQINENRHV